MTFSKLLIGFYLTLFFLTGASAQQLKLEDVLSKHRAAVGAVEKRQALKNMVLLGTSEFASKLPQRTSIGKLAIVSDPSNLLFIASFTGENYPYEKVGLFGGKINIPYVTPGVRSPLGDFLAEHPSILEKGLFAGNMTLKWGLLDSKLKTSKLFLDGTKKVNDRKAYVVEYFTEAGAESLKVRLFFDAENFRHIRSEYREQFSGKDQPLGRFGTINGYVVELSEDFSDFKAYDGITLPNTSKVHFMGSSNKGTWEYDWTFKLNEVKFNQPLKEGFFNF